MAWDAARAQHLAKEVIEGRTKPGMDQLTPQRILSIAIAAVRIKGYAEYTDFAEELFLEIMAGRKPTEAGFRLTQPEKVLLAHLWTKQGRPARFYPPVHAVTTSLAETADDDYAPVSIRGEPLSTTILRERR